MDLGRRSKALLRSSDNWTSPQRDSGPVGSSRRRGSQIGDSLTGAMTMTEDTVYRIKSLAAYKISVLGLISQLLFKRGANSLGTDFGEKFRNGW